MNFAATPIPRLPIRGRRRPSGLAAACALTLAICAGPLDAQRGSRGRDRTPAPDPVAGTWERVEFASKSLGRDTRMSIFVPNGYRDEANAAKRYPLVLWLHGMNEDDQRFVGRGGGETLDRLMAAGEIPEMLFVCPADGTRRSFYVNRDGDGDNFEDLITKDVLEYMKSKYRVAEGRQHRAIMGISMGGMGALRIAFKHPELFGTVSTHSAAVLPLDPDDLPPRFKAAAGRLGLDEVFGDPIDKAVWARENPLNLATQATAKSLDGLRIRFDAGTEDRYGFQVGNAALHDVLKAAEIEHTWDLVEDGGHAWGSGFQLKSLEASLRFVSDGIAPERAARERAKAGLKGLLDAIPSGGGKGRNSGGDGKRP